MFPSRTKALVELLKSLFTIEELLRFAAVLSYGNVMELPPVGTISLETVAFEMVQTLERHGQIGDELFA